MPRAFRAWFQRPSQPANGHYYTFHASGDSEGDVIKPQAFRAAVASLFDAWDRWRDNILPEILEEIEYYRVTDFDALSDQRLTDEIDRLIEVRLRSGHLHDQVTIPYFQAMNLLLDTYTKLTGRDEVAGIRLVQGYGNMSVEADQGLWKLSRLAESAPVVKQILADVNSESALSSLKALAQRTEAAPFLIALRNYLDKYGWRSDLFEMATPTWAEDPTIPLCQIRTYLEMTDYNPDREMDRARTVRNQAIRQTMKRLSPQDKRRMETVLEVATKLSPLQEDHNFFIDQRLAFMPRRLVMAIGRRLISSGALENAADVFYLHVGEVRSALYGENPEFALLVDRRKREMKYWAAITPPAFIGAPKPRSDTPDRFSGSRWLEAEQPNILQGNGCSAGVARGPARVLRNLGEVDRLRRGDILIDRTTMPAWTPLFAVAKAVITETGGILSHAAVTAREYGLPAVMGVNNATRIIRDGQMLEVDGSEGTVRMVT